MPYLLKDTQITNNGDTMTVLLSTKSEIPYVELFGGENYTETWGIDSSECTRIVACLWRHRETLRRDFVGDSYWMVGAQCGGVTTNLWRDIPERHPTYDYMFCTGVDMVRGLGVPTNSQQIDLAKALSAASNRTGMNDGEIPSTMNDEDYGPDYCLCFMTVKYAQLPYVVFRNEDTPETDAQGELGRFVHRLPAFSVENLDLPGNAFQFVGGSKIPQGPVKLFPTQQISHIWKHIPTNGLDFAALQAAQGKVNSTPFDYVYNGEPLYEAGTLLLVNVELRPLLLPYGTLPLAYPAHVDVVFNYNHRETGWNNYFHYNSSTQTGEFLEISTDGITHGYGTGEGAKHVYDDTDLSLLYKLKD